MLGSEILHDLQNYLDSRFIIPRSIIAEPEVCYSNAPTSEQRVSPDMNDFVKLNKKPSFSSILLGYIDKLAVNDSEVYKKAGIDRRHFSKIRSNPDYHPGKNTAIAFALALGLDLKEAGRLIGAAGYTLSDSETCDLVITFCLERKIYDINDVNLALDYFSLKCLI